MKKILALALALIMTLSMASVAFAATTTVELSADEDVNGAAAPWLTVLNGEDIILDLNGYNVCSDYGTYTILVEEGGKLTIIGAGTITNDSEYSTTICTFGELIIDADENGNAPTITRETTAQTSNSAIKVEKTGSLTVNAGVIGGNQRSIQSIGNVVINGGTFNKTVEAWSWDAAQSKMTINGGTFNGNVTVDLYTGYESIDLTINNGTFNGELVLDKNGIDVEITEVADIEVNAGKFADDSFLAFTPSAGVQRPGTTVVLSEIFARADYKVKSYDFTTGSKGYQGSSYVDEIKINKDNELVLVLKANYKLAEDKALKGEVVLQDKATKELITVPVAFTVANDVEEIFGGRKADDATVINPGENALYVMDEDGGYVTFTEEDLTGTVKMNKEEKAFLNIWYGYIEDVTEDTIDAFEDFVGEEYIEDATIEYYTFETRAFKNEVAFAVDAWEEDEYFFYLWDGEKLSAIDAVYNDDDEVEAYEWTGLAEGTIIVTDVEIVLAAETTKNPDTGANDVVGMASALAVVSLVAAGAISLKK